jgi:hypothetical protein
MNKFFTDADVEYIKQHTERAFSDKQQRDEKIKQMERDNEECLQKNSK